MEKEMNWGHDGKQCGTLDHYDYLNQAWIRGGLVVNCGHPDEMDCRCYQRLHAGEVHTCTDQCHRPF